MVIEVLLKLFVRIIYAKLFESIGVKDFETENIENACVYVCVMCDVCVCVYVCMCVYHVRVCVCVCVMCDIYIYMCVCVCDV